ncbi:MAG TPA: FAD-dependent oxidoreductase [Candidatus Krumholzibacteria bacterium]|nr:FAD-dependent oxidoreductase [Candidatus Krumholzibacteria bacterium]
MTRPTGRTDDLHPLGLVRLLSLLRDERAHRATLLGLHQDLCLFALDGRLALERDGTVLASPVGVAAGPHTQLSQNLVASWLSGARWLELKTVQVLDELDVPRPCIDMTDAGFNCEWSQELKLDQSYAEYADAWAAIRILQHEAGVYDPADPGFAFDLSVGYDLAGIRGPAMQRFLDRAADARRDVEQRLAAAAAAYPGARDIEAPASLAASVTLSTMHGCPPAEIESIARFLLEERGLHTSVKLNPTLVGPEALRGLLNGRLGWDLEVGDEAFTRDPDFATVVDIIRSLQATAARVGRRFGVKLTNTLPVRNPGGVLPAQEASRYLSGRALHPIAAAAAARLQEVFGGALDISFAGGADAVNTPDLVRCGLKPVTVCSDLLRPGGYLRLRPYLEAIGEAMQAAGAADLDAFAGDAAARTAALTAYAARAADDPRYRQDHYHDRSIRTARPLGAFDCIAAPCVGACPTEQDIPGYLHHAARGDFAAGLAVVQADNPLPVTAGMVCDHPCQHKCTRQNGDEGLRIRDLKRFLVEHGGTGERPAQAAAAGRRVAVVGAGPAGLGCARVLAMAGVAVTVYEAAERAGGMVTGVIPRFRLAPGHFDDDLARLEALGVDVRCGERIDAARFAALRGSHDAVFVAVGAQADRPLDVPGEDLPGVEPALAFLAAARTQPDRDLPGVTVVIGGGNSAMDAARTALRMTGDGRRVHIVYRRTKGQMPAEPEEIRAVGAEGVTIHELRAPAAITVEDGRLVLTCDVMALGAPDASGRARPVPVPGRQETFACERIIPAVGQRIVCDFVDDALAKAARSDAAHGLDGVWLGGDLRTGPANLVEAMGDGRRAAEAILASFSLPSPLVHAERAPMPEARRQDLAARVLPARHPVERLPDGAGDFGLVIATLSPDDAEAEAARCLECDLVCDVCVAVCPNRANIAWETAPRRLPLVRVVADGRRWRTEPDGELAIAQQRQTAHVADFCNHCGNCTTFCPTSGRPFLDKPRFALADLSWRLEDDIHRLEQIGGSLRIRRKRGGREQVLTRSGDTLTWEADDAVVTLDAETFAVRQAVLPAGTAALSLREAAELAVLMDGLSGEGGMPWLVS